MPFDASVTAEKAEQARAQKLSIGRGRRIPPAIDLVERMASENTYHIFSVGPWPQDIRLGSAGNVFVPACPKNKKYVEANRHIKGIESELTIKDEYEYNSPLMTDGWKFAQEVVGLGRGRNPAHALTHFGLFASKNAVPTEEELFQARTLLNAKCSEIVREARDLYATDRKAFAVIVKRNRHFKAADVLNLTDEPWMVEQTPSQRKKCGYCQAMNDEAAVKCAKCNEIIDVAAYRALKEKEEEALTTPRSRKASS